METLAYLHLALAYETSQATDTDLIQKHLSLFSGWHSKQRYSSAWIPLLTALAVLGMASQSLAELKIGSTGAPVSRLQERLRQRGFFNGSSTGNFGSQTRDAVIRFQRSQGLKADGVVGAGTQAALLGTRSQPRSQSYAVTGRAGSFLIVDPGTSSYVAANNQPPQDSQDRVIDYVVSQNLPPQTEIDYYPASSQTTDYEYRGYRVLQRGDRGADVSRLQQRLKDKDLYYGEIDGIFGSETELAVKRFQYNRGLYASGIVDTTTQNALDLRLKQSRYVVVVPVRKNNTLSQVLQYIPEAYSATSQRGAYVHAGAFDQRATAESRAYLLRSHQLDARVVYRR